ncbi:hypothetical protein [Spongiimicrobium sp. 3-5]|uniref:hypothetical protein n=1 Tax=Spongiimicrobium sp. 3-5 TaxID=3332596 RepID=UPI0039811328
MKKLFLLVLFPLCCLAQKSIQKSDVEIYTQLTFLKVDPSAKIGFEKNMGHLASLAKKAKLNERFDWLTYISDTQEYLIVNFSDGIPDVLSLKGYRDEFYKQGLGVAFDQALDSLNSLGIGVGFNYVKEMILPWSTVTEISVAQFPLSKMMVYEISMNKLDAFDVQIRKLAGLLKETAYPYPLESSRGSVGAYGKVILVWFYDDLEVFEGVQNLTLWMQKRDKLQELTEIQTKIKSIISSEEVYRLTYNKELSN